MRTFRCPRCEFTYLDDDPPVGDCPGCGAPWPMPHVLRPPAQVPSALSGEELVEQGLIEPELLRPAGRSAGWLGGLVLGVALVLIGLLMFFDVRTKSAAATEQRLLEQAEAQLKLQSQEQQEAWLASMTSQLEQSANELARVKDRYDRVARDLEYWRTTANELEQEVFTLRLLTGQSYARNWLLLGPYPELDLQREQALLQLPRWDAETEFAGQTWQSYESSEDRIHLDRAFNNRDRVHGYAACWVYAERTREVELHLGSDDGLVVWVNREEVSRFDGQRSAGPGQSRVVVQFQKGWNEVLARIDNRGGGEWALYCEFRSPEASQPLKLYSTWRQPRAAEE